ncbi:hypothetical protein NL676_028993 [Syzygium grande]|nr:hypothetical protein NL676_028993 [Syzygium grande]
MDTAKVGLTENANKILNEAIFKGFVPDQFTYCSLISGFCQDGDVRRAVALFNEVSRRGVKSNVVLYNTVIRGLSQNGLIMEALELMTEMSENGCSPDIWTYNLVINGLCKMGCVSDAYGLMDDAITRGYIPDIFTFNTLVDGFCKQLKLSSAIAIIERMCSHGVFPDNSNMSASSFTESPVYIALAWAEIIFTIPLRLNSLLPWKLGESCPYGFFRLSSPDIEIELICALKLCMSRPTKSSGVEALGSWDRVIEAKAAAHHRLDSAQSFLKAAEIAKSKQ